jgi:glycosyltransferase involved in cell wall biosynthesis
MSKKAQSVTGAGRPEAGSLAARHRDYAASGAIDDILGNKDWALGAGSTLEGGYIDSSERGASFAVAPGGVTAKGEDELSAEMGALLPEAARHKSDSAEANGVFTRGETGDAGVAPTPPVRLSVVAQPAPIRWFLDEITDKEAVGWIMRDERPSHRYVVALKENEQVLTRTVASRFRPDLLAAGIGDGCHSFVLPMPRSLLDGAEHLLDIVEQESGLPLNSKPIPWRSAAGTGGIALTGLSGPPELTVLEGLLSPPQGKSPSTARVDVHHRVARSVTRVAAAAGRTVVHAASSAGTRVIFDISDLVYYIGHHPNLTGIQRVQSSIVLSIVAGGLLQQTNVIFLSFNARCRKWMDIPIGFLVSLLEDLLLDEAQRLVAFAADEARYGVLPGATEFTGAGVLDQGSPSVFCLLGAAWVQRDYLHRVLAFKRQFGTRFVMTVHDLIPIYARETCDQGTARVFEEFLRRALRHTDHVLCVSENTARDLQRYVASLSLPAPAITVTKNGSSFEEFLPTIPQTTALPEGMPDRFVLFVGTIEGRKNHRLILDLWRRMVNEGDDPPYLVCVGRVGWKSEEFLTQLVETDYLNGKVLLLQDVSDAKLRQLYAHCMFTVCPSLYEGWGLPVGESLAAGKVCVCSERASLPEVAGKWGVYLDVDNPEACWKTIRGLIAAPDALRRHEAKIRREYKLVTWRQVAEKVVEACRTAAKVEWQAPYPYGSLPYSLETSFGSLGHDSEGVFGDDLLAGIIDARKGHFLHDPLQQESFLRGEEARAGGIWAEPEHWGTWMCHPGGELAFDLPPDDSVIYWVFLRLRAAGPLSNQRVRLFVNGAPVFHDSLSAQPRDIHFTVRKRAAPSSGWRMRLRAEVNLSPDLISQVAATDSRVPTLGFERLIIVPENDLKTRLDVLYTLLP